MSSSVETLNLGQFATDQGARSKAVGIAGVLAIAAVAATGLRLVLDRADPDTTHHWLTLTGEVLGVAAFAVAMVGVFQTATQGMSGRGLIAPVIVMAVVGGFGAFFYGATHEGTLNFERFMRNFFDFELMRTLISPLARGALNTVKLAFVSELLAVLLGLFISTMHLSKRAWLHFPAVGYVDMVRGIPLVVMTLLVAGAFDGFGIDPGSFTIGATILTINASAYIAEIFRAGIQSLSRGQTDAARSLGMPQGTTMLYVVIPQAVRAVIPPLMSEFIALVKDTAIVVALLGFTIGEAEIFGVARTAQASTFNASPYVAAAIAYLIITVPMTRLVGRAERRLRAGLA